MNKRIFFIFPVILAVLLWGCKKQSTNDDEAEFDSVIEEQAAFGYEVNNVTAISEDIYDLTQESEFSDEPEIPGLGGVSVLKRLAEALTAQIAPNMPQGISLTKIAADSQIYLRESTINGYGKRVALYYDPETGVFFIKTRCYMYI